VDFLFSFLALPVGTAVKLLGKESMVGCMGNVYTSVEALDDTYVEAGAAKDALHRALVVGRHERLFLLLAGTANASQPAPPKEALHLQQLRHIFLV
jgi:hypothetical protein